MKTIFCVILLCTVEFCVILASPISQNDVQITDDLSIKEDPTDDVKQSTNFNGYITTPGIGVHKWHNIQKKNWNDARNTCLNEGGHLAIINSAAEEALIIKYMSITGNVEKDQLWIGLHELFKKDEWVSVKDERLDAIGYAHWKSNQPDGTPKEHCVTITPVGMNDYICESELFFVCEMQF